ncbi:MAG: hypothetical protein MI921_29270, partial [Cytophagales bacterium]|nr:hypothetical protein [Cytophagales bacterium]
ARMEWCAARKSRSGEADKAGGRRSRSARRAAISVHSCGAKSALGQPQPQNTAQPSHATSKTCI